MAPMQPEMEEHLSLCEALDRVLHKGVVVRGDLIISVAGVDLIYLQLQLLLASVETAMQYGALPPELQADAVQRARHRQEITSRQTANRRR